MIYVTATMLYDDGLCSRHTTNSGYMDLEEVAKRLQFRVLLGWDKCGKYSITRRYKWAGEMVTETVEYHKVQQ